MKLASAIAAFGAVVAFAMSCMPAFSADNATVAATVTPKAACLLVSTPTVTLGTQSFSDIANTNKVVATTKPWVSLCASNEKVMVHGTDATSPASKWTLSGAAGNPCAEGVNVFHELVVNLGVTAAQQREVRLSADQSSLYPLPGQTNSSFQVQLEVEMPCGGSGGAGVQNTFSYVFTAVA